MRFMVYQVLCSSKATVFYTIGACNIVRKE